MNNQVGRLIFFTEILRYYKINCTKQELVAVLSLLSSKLSRYEREQKTDNPEYVRLKSHWVSIDAYLLYQYGVLN